MDKKFGKLVLGQFSLTLDNFNKVFDQFVKEFQESNKKTRSTETVKL